MYCVVCLSFVYIHISFACVKLIDVFWSVLSRSWASSLLSAVKTLLEVALGHAAPVHLSKLKTENAVMNKPNISGCLRCPGPGLKFPSAEPWVREGAADRFSISIWHRFSYSVTKKTMRWRQPWISFFSKLRGNADYPSISVFLVVMPHKLSFYPQGACLRSGSCHASQTRWIGAWFTARSRLPLKVMYEAAAWEPATILTVIYCRRVPALEIEIWPYISF